MIYIWTRYKIYISVAVVILLIICSIIYKNTVFDAQIALVEEPQQIEEALEEPETNAVENDTITVYVCGSVKNKINVTLPKDSRVEDAIKMAGGVTEDADLNAINMAQKLSDEDMIYVPKIGEKLEESKSSYVTQLPAKKGKVNINKATAEELDSLPGVGPAIAQKIIEYRNSSGGFKSIEELNNVSGIGPEKFKDIKNLITVD